MMGPEPYRASPCARWKGWAMESDEPLDTHLEDLLDATPDPDLDPRPRNVRASGGSSDHVLGRYGGVGGGVAALAVWGWWLRALVISVVLAAGAGGLIAALFYVISRDSDWRDLGAVAIGLVVGAWALATAWLVALVLMLRRFAQAGRRVAAGAAAVGALAVVAVGSAALVSADVLQGGVAGAAVAVVAIAGPPLVVRWAGTKAGTKAAYDEATG